MFAAEDPTVFARRVAHAHMTRYMFVCVLGQGCTCNIPYSRKIWRALNLADWPQPV